MEILKKKTRTNYSHSISGAKKDKRREEAQMRNDAYAKLTPEQKLARLDATNLVATRQRKKLEKLINNNPK
jgi:Spy/CpxP family protein refolding chaperone